MDEKDFENYHLQLFRRSEIYPLMPMLRSGVLHTTSIEGYKGIRAQGQILPNVNEKFPFSYPQSQGYYGYSIGAICLFDFETAREDQYGVNYFTAWDTFFLKREPNIFFLPHLTMWA